MAGSGKGPLRIAIEDFIETFLFGKVISDRVKGTIEAAEDAILGAHDEAFEELENIPGLPEFLKFRSLKNAGKKFQGGLAAVGGFGLSLGMSAASAFMAPIMRVINYRIDGIVGSGRVDPPVLFAMKRRVPDFQVDTKEAMFDLGWNTFYQDAFEELTKLRAQEDVLLTRWLRGDLPETDLDTELTRRGWLTEDIEHLKAARQVIPPPQDIIRLAVREAFNPEAIRQFTLDVDFPEEVGDWAEKVGLSRDWALKYWIAHWEHPSLQMAFQMLHRLRPDTTKTPFTEADLDLLMRIQDVSPYWRERLKAISYAPYTRVDVRRMYGLGVLDEDAVKANYLDLGYDEEHAQRLMEFTVRDATIEEKGLSRAAIQQAYKRKVFSREQAASSLQEIGFTSELAEFWLGLTDWEIQQDMLKDELDVVSFLYVEGEIDEPQVYGRLGRFNLPAEQMSLLLRQWDVKRLKQVKLPTEAQLEDFYRRDIIPFETLTDTLKRKGYGAERIDWITRRIDQEQAETAAREAEAAQKEAERISQAARATTYQREVADLNTTIANHRLAIADLKLSRYSLEDPKAVKAIPEQVALHQALIAELQVAKAERRSALLAPPTT